MEIKEITNKNIWEQFLAECDEKTFMQSWNWGEFHQKMGQKIWRFGVYEDDKLNAVVLTVKIKAKRGTFLAIEHGPITKSLKLQFSNSNQVPRSNFQIIKTLLENLKEIARKENVAFIRISPIWERNEENAKIFRELGFRQAPTYAAAESSWKLDITPPEEELLGQMRKTTRYLIRQALKNKDIEVVQSTEKEDLAIFGTLQEDVSARQQFVPFSRKYTEAEFDAFFQDNNIAFFFGKYKGQVVAAALVIFWSGIGFYHQAASKPEYTKLSLPYLVQWEAMREAKRRGCNLYDFWGYVDPKKYPNHPWAGPTLFKMGFGGRPYEYIKTQDHPLSWKYWSIAMFELLRKKHRHL